ncbi:unnamed protein product [Dibothriocephalus latus]|uniref:Rab-GAP TBC domain-containing protein n=1 Tax=Dibothriocephalus latus TaxID=60516 RepID=A0A3P7LH38_DIBLA|nr:unnamed protein product [Dibothriocephalus latus]
MADTSLSPTSNPSATSSALGSSRIYNQFQHLQALLEVLDPVMASHMRLSEDNAHLYFYRWFLLDFKRELKYEDVFRVWETIWTARRLVTHDFGVFLAFALIQCYRDIILFYCGDYTDIIRFYNAVSRLEQQSLVSLAAEFYVPSSSRVPPRAVAAYLRTDGFCSLCRQPPWGVLRMARRALSDARMYMRPFVASCHA